MHLEYKISIGILTILTLTSFVVIHQQPEIIGGAVSEITPEEQLSRELIALRHRVTQLEQQEHYQLSCESIVIEDPAQSCDTACNVMGKTCVSAGRELTRVEYRDVIPVTCERELGKQQPPLPEFVSTIQAKQFCRCC